MPASTFRLGTAFKELWLQDQWKRFPLTRTMLTSAFALTQEEDRRGEAVFGAVVGLLTPRDRVFPLLQVLLDQELADVRSPAFFSVWAFFFLFLVYSFCSVCQCCYASSVLWFALTFLADVSAPQSLRGGGTFMRTDSVLTRLISALFEHTGVRDLDLGRCLRSDL